MSAPQVWLEAKAAGMTVTVDVWLVEGRKRTLVTNHVGPIGAHGWVDQHPERRGQVWFHYRSAATSIAPDWRTKAHMERVR